MTVNTGFERAALWRIALALTVLTPVPAMAQVNARPPTREELSPRAIAGEPAARGGRLTVVGNIERAPCPLADPRYANVTVNFADVRLEGLRVVDAAALRDSWSDLAGHDVPTPPMVPCADGISTRLEGPNVGDLFYHMAEPAWRTRALSLLTPEPSFSFATPVPLSPQYPIGFFDRYC